MLKHRLFYGALLIAGLVGLLCADDWVSGAAVGDRMPGWLCEGGLCSGHGAVVAAVVMVLVVLGTWELRRLFRAAGHAPLLVWPVLVNVVLILCTFYARNGPAAGEIGRRSADYQYTVVWLTIALFGACILIGRRRRTERAVGDIATTLLAIFYLGLLPQYLVRVRLADPSDGAWLLLYFVGTVKACDISAYFTGRAVGRHKLIEWLSPKKTIEGLAGGVAGSVVVATLVPILVEQFAPASSDLHGLFPELGRACVFGVMMALFGQAGDLLESLIKRDAQAKDSAGAVPAFGGVLDILDSPLAAAPIAYWMLLQ